MAARKTLSPYLSTHTADVRLERGLSEESALERLDRLRKGPVDVVTSFLRRASESLTDGRDGSGVDRGSLGHDRISLWLLKTV